jgi:serine protease SohB
LEFLYEYGLFLAKAVTIVVALLLVIGSLAATAMKQKQGKDRLTIVSLSDRLQDLVDDAKSLLLNKEEFKQYQKEQKKLDKSKKNKTSSPRLYVIDFDGSMDANEVDALREEITAILMVADEQDEVLVRLESPGGVVHGYGLAASQLQRFKDKGIKLTISVDKVAASGGYMMACVADEIICAPFAIIGSIGVIAQLPNFNKLLKKHDIEFEQHTAGEYKRTLTVFGENNQQGREKFQSELEEIHQAFKQHVQRAREIVEIEKVATGEFWLGEQALELKLVDKLQTSDDFLLEQNQNKSVYGVKYSKKKSLSERFTSAADSSLKVIINKLFQLNNRFFS